MIMQDLLNRLEREPEDEKMPMQSLLLGTLAVTEGGTLSVYKSLDVLRFQADAPFSVDIIVQIIDIHSMKHDFENEVLYIKLRPKSINRINKYFEQFEHSCSIKHGGAPIFEIQFKNLTDEQSSFLSNFLSSIPPYVDKSEVKADKDAHENLKKENTRPSRKKKEPFADVSEISGDDEPVQKKPRKRKLLQNSDIVDLSNDPNPKEEEGRPKRNLRNRRAKSKAQQGTIVLDDEIVSEKEKRDFDAAIDASLKLSGGVKGGCPPVKKERKPKVDPYAHIDKSIELFHYPFKYGINNEIVVKMEDYLCLGKAEYLSDVIIDFVFSYIVNEKFTPEMREKVHVFPSSFYTMYSTSADYPGWNSEENANKSAIQKRYERIEGMLDPDVNYFEKEFLVFPLFQTNHWFLSIVCFPKLTQNVLFDDGTPTDDEVKRNVRKINDENYKLPHLKTSCILTFDSVNSNVARRSTAMKHIRGFLTSHHERYYKNDFPIGRLTACSIHCPLQPNNVDCGCFIIEFFERFFVTDPFDDFRLPITKKDWFSPKIVQLGKRREIADIVKEKMNFWTAVSNLPQIELPELKYASEQLDSSSITIEDDNNDNGNNNNNNNGDDDMNGNNNNDEEFNNNNDFNCLDSNQVVPVSSGENEQVEPTPYVESPEIFSDHEQKTSQPKTAEQMFDTIKALDRKSFLNMHTQDKEGTTENHTKVNEATDDSLKDKEATDDSPKAIDVPTNAQDEIPPENAANISESATEIIPNKSAEKISPENCENPECDTDVIMEEPPVDNDENPPCDDDIDMKDVSDKLQDLQKEMFPDEPVEQSEAIPEEINLPNNSDQEEINSSNDEINSSIDPSKEENSSNAAEKEINDENIEPDESEKKVEESEVTTADKEPTAQPESDNDVKNIEEQAPEALENANMSTSLPLDKPENSTCVHECQPDEIVIAAAKKEIEDSCDNNSIILSD